MASRINVLPNLLAAAILAALPAASVWAQQPSQAQRDRAQDDNRPPPPRSLSDAVRRVERDTRGEVLSAERIQYDGRDMHRVKVVDDRGRVRVFMQDPQRRDRGEQRQSRGSSSNEGNGGRPNPRRAPTRDTDD